LFVLNQKNIYGVPRIARAGYIQLFECDDDEREKGDTSDKASCLVWLSKKAGEGRREK
jgi:hypothetical protein